MAKVENSKRKTNEKSGRGFLGLGPNDEETPGFDWGTVEPSRLCEIITLITGRGGAVRFGYSRDGQAGSIGVYYGDDRDTAYIRPNQDPEEILGVIERMFERFPYSGGKSPSRG